MFEIIDIGYVHTADARLALNIIVFEACTERSFLALWNVQYRFRV